MGREKRASPSTLCATYEAAAGWQRETLTKKLNAGVVSPLRKRINHFRSQLGGTSTREIFVVAYLRASNRHKLGGNALFGVGRAAMHFPLGMLNLVVVVFVVFLLILRIVVVHLQSKLLSYLALVAADLRPGDLHVLGGALVHGDGE